MKKIAPERLQLFRWGDRTFHHMHTRQTTDLIRGQSGPSPLREKKRDAVFVIVAEPSKVSAPAAPPRQKPWMMILVLLLMKLGDGVEPMDEIEYKEVDFPFADLENKQDVTKDTLVGRDWYPVVDGLDFNQSNVMDCELYEVDWCHQVSCG